MTDLISEISVDLENTAEISHLLDSLLKQWEILQNIANVFRYKLSVHEEKTLPGELKFYCQLNPKRSTARRKPQQIRNVRPEFDSSAFNFNHAKPKEKLAKIKWKDSEYTLLINQSPLTPLHTLIIPRIEDNTPQILSFDALDFSLKFLACLGDKNYRIGYNSPGAMASVNHLHLHLLYLEKDLYADNVSLKPIPKYEGFYRVDSFIKGFCFILFPNIETNEFNKTEILKIFEFIQLLCVEDIPHNLFITPQRNTEEFSVRVFVFIREKFCTVKDSLELNVGFCEFAGYFPVGDKRLFDSLNEDYVVGKIKKEVGCSFEKCCKHFY